MAASQSTSTLPTATRGLLAPVGQQGDDTPALVFHTSCMRCQRMHERCDGATPCARCIRVKQGAACAYAVKTSGRRSRRPAPEPAPVPPAPAPPDRFIDPGPLHAHLDLSRVPPDTTFAGLIRMIEAARPSPPQPLLDSKKLVVNHVHPGTAWEALATALCAFAVLEEPLPDGPLRRIAVEPNGLHDPAHVNAELVDVEDERHAPVMPPIPPAVLLNCYSAWAMICPLAVICCPQLVQEQIQAGTIDRALAGLMVCRSLSVHLAADAIAEVHGMPSPLADWPPVVPRDPIAYLRAAKYDLLRRRVSDRSLSTIQALVSLATHESLALSDGAFSGYAPALIAQSMIIRELETRLDFNGGVWRRRESAVQQYDVETELLINQAWFASFILAWHTGVANGPSSHARSLDAVKSIVAVGVPPPSLDPLLGPLGATIGGQIIQRRHQAFARAARMMLMVARSDGKIFSAPMPPSVSLSTTSLLNLVQAQQLLEAASIIHVQHGEPTAGQTSALRLSHIAMAVSKLGSAGIGDPMLSETPMTERSAQLILNCVHQLIVTSVGLGPVDLRKLGELTLETLRTVVRLVKHTLVGALELLEAVMQADTAVSATLRGHAGSMVQSLLQLRSNVLGLAPDDPVTPAIMSASDVIDSSVRHGNFTSVATSVGSSSGASRFGSAGSMSTVASVFDDDRSSGAGSGRDSLALSAPYELWGEHYVRQTAEPAQIRSVDELLRGLGPSGSS